MNLGTVMLGTDRNASLIGAIVSIVVFCPLDRAEAVSFRTKIRTETKMSVRSGTLRELVEALSTAQDVNVVLDPRLDPRALVEAPKDSKALIDLFDHLAGYAGATARPIGENVLITPISDADRIATLAALRDGELMDRPKDRRTLSLMRPRDIRSEVQPVSPQELIKLTAQVYQIAEPPDALPYDLWMMDLRQVTAAEALACTLVPLGKAFEWNGGEIVVTSLTDTLSVERTHRVRNGLSESDVLGLIETVVGQRVVPSRIDESFVSYSATLAQHERFDGLMTPTKPRTAPASAKRYTLKVDLNPAGAVLEALETQGLDFAWDRTGLTEAGVNLSQAVSIDVKKVTAEELISLVAEQIGAKVQIVDGRPVIVAE